MPEALGAAAVLRRMNPSPEFLLCQLLSLRKRFGTLNGALDGMYIEAYGEASQRAMEQDLGVSRWVIRKYLQERSEKARSDGVERSKSST